MDLKAGQVESGPSNGW